MKLADDPRAKWPQLLNSTEQAMRFCRLLRPGGHVASHLPEVTGVVRDPNDDMVIACALAASASYLVTRDPDLLTLKTPTPA